MVPQSNLDMNFMWGSLDQNTFQVELQQYVGGVHTSWQNQEVPWMNPYPLQMSEETIQELAISGSQSHGLSITQRNPVFHWQDYPQLSGEF